MPRCARIKSFDSIYHIMVKSVGGTLLFRCDDDKERYLQTIKRYQENFKFKVYAYCLMDNHGHIIIDACGADISKIMHGINQSYAQYYNRKYERAGHLFADRFKSKIVDSDRYLVTLSGYIHNNPSDIDGYKNNVHKYRYSSLGIYLGIRKDSLALVDAAFVMQQFSRDVKNARMDYLKFVQSCDKDELKRVIAFKEEKAEYRSERNIIVRNVEPEKVIDFVSKYTNEDGSSVKLKHVKNVKALKSLCAFLMRGLCDMRQKDICFVMGNITQSYASKLCFEGYMLTKQKDDYRNIIMDFLKEYAASY
ncbi:transposase [Fonticella tunisiensis]|uniref:REP element-mobilizing transposase RayT n=1 Tax=Fonticella tunisiensis TaxID=1096341 RepID=A0A4R7KPY4_9CLOT|nr:transposase [Fonticella tunisiensis]TDT61085.1 REP element-mobilizing transposase RayT [Fonticella tunisiensis]